MRRFFPLLFLCSACATDPLDLTVVTLDEPLVEEGFTVFDPAEQAALPHEDLTLRLSFRADAGARGRIELRGKYDLELPSLAVTSLEPDLSELPSPGVWHDLEIQYLDDPAGAPALLPAVYLDGQPVYYQEMLPATTEEDGPLRFVVDTGTIELADVRYAPVAGRSSTVDADGLVQLNVPLLRYDYFHLPPGSKDYDGWGYDGKDFKGYQRSGYINRIDLNNIRDRNVDYAVRFTGRLDVPQAGEYYFGTWGTGKTELLLDGKTVTGHRGAPQQWGSADSLQLAAGPHDFELRIVQHHGWSTNRLSYRKTGTSEPLRFLNTLEERVAIATPATPDPRELETDGEPYLLRSFLYFPAPKLYEPATKRTHVVSVGEGGGPHYSVDLQTGALLQVWRGGFADVHDMWDGRGEPQVMRPLGNAIGFDGAPLGAAAADKRWPAAPTRPAADDFTHAAYELDDAGRPTFFYTDGNHRISDKIVPAGNGLLREINHTAERGNYYVQLAAARSVTETAPGEFELRSPGLNLRIDAYNEGRLTLQRSGGLDRLIAELPAGGGVRYRLDW